MYGSPFLSVPLRTSGCMGSNSSPLCLAMPLRRFNGEMCGRTLGWGSRLPRKDDAAAAIRFLLLPLTAGPPNRLPRLKAEVTESLLLLSVLLSLPSPRLASFIIKEDDDDDRVLCEKDSGRPVHADEEDGVNEKATAQAGSHTASTTDAESFMDWILMCIGCVWIL